MSKQFKRYRLHAGFLRVGEFTYREAELELRASFFKWFLAKQHIRVPAGESCMELTIPASMTDPFRKGKTLIIAASGDAECPVEAMRRLQAIDYHRSPCAPLLCVGRYQQKSFTREYVVRSLQQIAITADLGQGAWNRHSFRRGAATWAAQVGVSECEIQILGRWPSDAHKAYIEFSLEQQVSLSKRFQNRHSQP